jgi:pyridoxal 5-phosphate dependent beta-lyase
MTSLPHEAVARRWRTGLAGHDHQHLDTAACSRTSVDVRRSVAEHLTLEAEAGGYVAEEQAAPVLQQARADLAGLLGFGAGDVAFLDSGSAALAQLLSSWRLQPSDSVWCAPSEWGPNLAAFDDHRLDVQIMDVDPAGRVDPEALHARLRRTHPAFIHLTAAAAHRALVQPVAAVCAVAAEYDVPVIVDTAQALGQLDLTASTAAACYGTGRKWIAGPRGVAYLAVRDPWQALLRPVTPALVPARWPGEDRPIRRLESREANVAGRIGLAAALANYLDIGPIHLQQRLTALGGHLRAALRPVPGWQVVDSPDAPGAIVSLAPTRGADPAAVRQHLLENRIVTTAAGPERAPLEMTGPLLRLSPHVDAEPDALTAVAELLAVR